MDTQTTPDRLPRYVRHRHRRPAFALQLRDGEIVRLVAQHRVIASGDIQLLLGGSEQGILRRLQKLFHAGYLDRPRSQRQLGNAPMVYALGQQGADLVARETGKRPIADWAEKNRQLRTHYLEHALMVSRFHVALRHAAQPRGDVALDRWLADGAVRDAVVVQRDGRRERIPIAPDAFFTLNVSDADNPGRIHVMLEADRGTMSVPRFAQKIRGYFAWWRSGQAEERMGMKNFIVATITRSEERADHLLAAARSVAERGTRIFIFAPESAYLPASRALVLNAIWRTPDDDVLHTLLE